MSNAYLVDVGVVVDKDEYPTCYSNVYDKARGYYDEDRYLVDDLDKAKKEALQYVADGVDKTYAIITNQGQRDTLDFDANDSSISYDVADIVYSAVKRNGRIIESFTEASNIGGFKINHLSLKLPATHRGWSHTGIFSPSRQAPESTRSCNK